MDRTEIGNCIIAGIAEGDGVLNQMSEIVTRLELAGWVIVPREPTTAMLKAACASMSPGKRPTPDRVNVKEKHRIRYGAMIDAAVARS